MCYFDFRVLPLLGFCLGLAFAFAAGHRNAWGTQGFTFKLWDLGLPLATGMLEEQREFALDGL